MATVLDGVNHIAIVTRDMDRFIHFYREAFDATLVRQRQPAQLDPWLQRATTSTLEAFQRFANGLRDDYEAVKAGVTLPWSTGPVEGHINRLKMLKRQMFGRARLDLLSRRFVGAPRDGPAQAPAEAA